MTVNSCLLGKQCSICELSLIDSTYSVLANTNLGNIDGIAMDDGDFYIWSSNSI